jgi:serine/threonine-protein kinase
LPDAVTQVADFAIGMRFAPFLRDAMSRELPKGTTVALRYTIVETLGRGGMAVVYRARHTSLDRDVALKVLDPVSTGPMATRFDREARNAARLSHPGCVRVFDYGAAVDGSRFIVMDLIDGPTLREELDARGQTSVGRAAWIAGELLKALAHAHRNGVLHRDIKPENVMFSSRNEVVLIDFGLSRLEDDAAVTALGTCIGSPSYLAPERLLGLEYDERADLYAVGVVLYELLAGRRPFEGEGALEVAVRQIDQEAEPIGWVRPEVPLDLAEVVHRALAKKPEVRFANAEEMLAALELAMSRAASADTLPYPQVEPDAVAVASPRLSAEDEATALLEAPWGRPSWWRRFWAWLRFGRWRWRRPRSRSGCEDTLTDRAAESLVGI